MAEEMQERRVKTGVGTVTAVRLMSAKTLRTTLSLSKLETEWRLMHSTLRPQSGFRPISSLSPLIPALSLPTVPTFDYPTARTTTRTSSIPSDRDFTRIQTRLTKLTSGMNLTLRPTLLEPDKTTELLLEQDEISYLKVKLARQRVPLEVSFRYMKGKCVCYTSKSTPEPNPALYDECHRKDFFQYTESGLRFKSDWLYLGLHCIIDSKVAVSIRFGVNREGNTRKGPSVLTDELDIYRKDEGKRLKLDREVKEILEKRKMRLWSRFSQQNFIVRNKKEAKHGKTPSIGEEREKRKQVVERKQRYLEQRRSLALQSLLRPQHRLEARLKLHEDQRLHRLQATRDSLWLTFLTFFQAFDSLSTLYQHRKTAIFELKTRIQAAVKLQIHFKRKVLGLDSKELGLRRGLCSIALYFANSGWILYEKACEMCGFIIKNSYKSRKVMGKFDVYFKKIRLIQGKWREYKEKREKWWREIGEIWAEVRKQETRGKKRKKSIIGVPEARKKEAIVGKYWEMCLKRFDEKWQWFEAQRRQEERVARPVFVPVPAKSILESDLCSLQP